VVRRAYLIIASLVAALCSASTVQGRTFDEIIESKQLIVSVYRDFAPYSSQENGVATGIDIDIAHAIAKSLAVSLVLRWTTADENVEDDLRNNLWKGDFNSKRKSDLMLRIPYDRAYSQLRDDIGELVHDRVHMFAPYHTERWQVAHNTKLLADVPTVSVFQYHDIGVEIDTVPAFYFTGAFRGSMTKHTKHFSTIALAHKAMLNGTVAAIMGMRSQVSYLLRDDTDNFQLAANGFPTIGRQQWDIGMAVKNENRQLSYAITDVVTSMVTSGQMAEIFSHYNAVYQSPSYYKVD